jgi:hypothetical protein
MYQRGQVSPGCVKVTHCLANDSFSEQVDLTLSCISRQLGFLVDSWLED